MKTEKHISIPKTWTVCLREDCPRGKECLRRIAVYELPNKEKSHPCLLPKVYEEDGCPHFADATPVVVAWGMRGLLSRVSPWHFSAMKHELEEYFGSHTTYYRYWNGLYPIGPKRQAWIADLLRRYGYNEAPCFGRTATEPYFPSLNE